MVLTTNFFGTRWCVYSEDLVLGARSSEFLIFFSFSKILLFHGASFSYTSFVFLGALEVFLTFLVFVLSSRSGFKVFLALSGYEISRKSTLDRIKFWRFPYATLAELEYLWTSFKRSTCPFLICDGEQDRFMSALFLSWVSRENLSRMFEMGLTVFSNLSVLVLYASFLPVRSVWFEFFWVA